MAKRTHAAPRSLRHAKHQPGLTTKARARVIGKPRGTTKLRQKPKNLDAKGRRIPRKGEHGPEKIQIDIDSCRQLVALGVSNEVIANCLGVCRQTLQARLAEDPDLRREFDRLKGERKRNLYAWLTRAAAAGNARILIHLASHELGMTPMRAVELSGRDGARSEVSTELRPSLERKLAKFVLSKRSNGREEPIEWT